MTRAEIERVLSGRPLFARFRAHIPARPLLLCRTCAAPWPCQPARLVLRFMYRGDPAGLRVHLGRKLAEALGDQPHVDPLTLATRFLGWLTPDT